MKTPVQLPAGYYETLGLHWSAQVLNGWAMQRSEKGGTRTADQRVQLPGVKPLVAVYHVIPADD